MILKLKSPRPHSFLSPSGRCTGRANVTTPSTSHVYRTRRVAGVDAATLGAKTWARFSALRLRRPAASASTWATRKCGRAPSSSTRAKASSSGPTCSSNPGSKGPILMVPSASPSNSALLVCLASYSEDEKLLIFRCDFAFP